MVDTLDIESCVQGAGGRHPAGHRRRAITGREGPFSSGPSRCEWCKRFSHSVQIALAKR